MGGGRVVEAFGWYGNDLRWRAGGWVFRRGGADGRAPDPAAIAALACEIQVLVRKRDRLAEELAGLDRQQAELQAKLMAMLGKTGVRPPGPATPEPPALPPGEHFPKAAWR